MTGAPASAAGGSGATPVPRGGKLGAAAVNQAGLWNIANILTMARLLLVPGFVLLLLHNGGDDPVWRAFAWAAFAVAMITDLFDGHLARTYNLVTDFGKIADPIADKAIMGAALICLSVLGDLPWWITSVILFREIGITLMRFWVIRHAVIPASRGGKLKTLAQGTAAGMYVLALTGPLATLRFWVMMAAVALTVVTGLDYVRQAVVLRRRGLAAERAAALEAVVAAADAVEPDAAPVVAVVRSEAPEVVAVVTAETGTTEGASPEGVGPESVEEAVGRAGTASGAPQGAGEQVAGTRGATDVER
ncbi:MULTISPECIES: CDP-diacylglycerol--glycerol-3-phosphate 3-phosphatidyltransferase [unclassified Streptomyces]|uniref:CDP-diacylglycerol--glycerol-3-phosphate 3-phosphatidyltransferase n=1 Tax=unclassified Streptomyces TaxID=2593676 RepID=UPI00048D1CA2|nr:MULTISPECIES: CDP-diacylglycerol--glycerol-3-phosphate 3-phosphatidyltransferase [unclassified Streptomyces]MYY18306.1 CDP-diacylglycerol--glycerol-3-phosphate 3-phosphatidyltransferase [Streptomyces sp. SID4912]SCD35535.1 CDP-diacylglycerol--glycerol-3-phosphate 3-phosphatidyltransferase [Streptomyces sp. DpondAA-D4]